MTQWTLAAHQWRKLFCFTSWVWCSVITDLCRSVSNTQVVSFAVDFGGTAAEFGVNLPNFWGGLAWQSAVSKGCLLPPVFSSVVFKQLGLMLSGTPAMCNFWFPEGGKKRLLSIMGALRGQISPNFLCCFVPWGKRRLIGVFPQECVSVDWTSHWCGYMKVVI